MYGAILGDIIGSPYEFNPIKRKKFPLFSEDSVFTDDTVMTIAVADALMIAKEARSAKNDIKRLLITSMHLWGRRYPGAGYGAMFYDWLRTGSRDPYNSFGNGSAMRVSSVGWLYDTVEETRRIARITSEVTHNHPEGIKGAEAVASAIFLARSGCNKAEIKDYVTKAFGYDLSRTCAGIRESYTHVESCQESVPEAIIAFLEGRSFEDVIRMAVSLGGDSDTQACIAGSIAEAFYGVSDKLKNECLNRIPEDMRDVIFEFDMRM